MRIKGNEEAVKQAISHYIHFSIIIESTAHGITKETNQKSTQHGKLVKTKYHHSVNSIFFFLIM